jgi:5,5'-dehydrodivanillate O-demethylase
MLTVEENELLTQVGAGTPGGELLRRYWHVVCPVDELSDEHRTRRVTLLGEKLVLYRDMSGTLGLVEERCPHRNASLYYGYVENAGIRCAYHGWMFDETGACIEQPFEPKQESTREAFHHTAYPVQEYCGLVFAYLGPQPAPLLPHWDVIARGDGTRVLEVHPDLDCNWLQCQENSLDPVHTHYLHVKRMVEKGLWDPKTLRAPERYAFQQFPLGIVKKRVYGNDGDVPWAQLGHPAIFPNILRHVIERPGPAGVADPDSIAALPIDIQIRVPRDDTHTQVYVMYFTPNADGHDDPTAFSPKVRYIQTKDDSGEFHLTSFPSQDEMAWETQGPITNRTIERLGVSDTGIVMWRRLLHEQIEVVQDGGDPIGVFRGTGDDRIIDLGPSREWDGTRWVTKAWQGWGETRVWESPAMGIEI